MVGVGEGDRHGVHRADTVVTGGSPAGVAGDDGPGTGDAGAGDGEQMKTSEGPGPDAGPRNLRYRS